MLAHHNVSSTRSRTKGQLEGSSGSYAGLSRRWTLRAIASDNDRQADRVVRFAPIVQGNASCDTRHSIAQPTAYGVARVTFSSEPRPAQHRWRHAKRRLVSARAGISATYVASSRYGGCSLDDYSEAEAESVRPPRGSGRRFLRRPVNSSSLVGRARIRLMRKQIRIRSLSFVAAGNTGRNVAERTGDA
jgi:hypothetical protein